MVDPAATPKIIKALNQEMDAINDPTACCTRNLSGRKRDLDNPPRNTWVGGPTKNQVSPEVEPERALGQYEPVRVMQCCNCASFFLEGEEAENCPECNSEEAEEFGKVVRNEEEDEEMAPHRLGRMDDEEEITEEDMDLDLDESLDLLEAHKLSEFNRKYGRKARVRGNNFYLINEGMKSRTQRLNREQLRSYNLSKFFGR